MILDINDSQKGYESQNCQCVWNKTGEKSAGTDQDQQEVTHVSSCQPGEADHNTRGQAGFYKNSRDQKSSHEHAEQNDIVVVRLYECLLSHIAPASTTVFTKLTIHS